MFAKKQSKQKEIPPITQFSGYYEFLSIDYPCPVYYEGFMYSSVTMAFQAARTNDMSMRRKISQVKEQQQFKKLVGEIQSATDWANRRLNVMIAINRDKFKRNKDLGLKLFATQTRLLINCYEKGGDAQAFWGVVQRNGQLQGLNTLGKILMNMREEMKIGTDSKNWVLQLNLEKQAALWPETNMIVQKQGDRVDSLLMINKNAFFFGSHESNDFKLDHSSISKFHSSIYFSSDMQVLIVDLNSTHGTVIERGGTVIKLQALRPQSLEDKDVIKFGVSTRRYIIYFSYEEVERRMLQKQQDARQELQKIQKLKRVQLQIFESEQKQQLKDYACLYVQNINRNFSYKDIKQTFNQYGPVKNVRINIDQKTGRFMGSVLVYYDQKIKIRQVLDNIAKEPLRFQFRIVAVNSDEADKIIDSFTSKDRKQHFNKSLQQQNKKIKTDGLRRTSKRMQSRSRSRSRHQSSSGSSSSSQSSDNSGFSQKKKGSKVYDK